MFKSARKDSGMSIEAAAFRLHIGSRTLINYENGHSSIPPDVVLKMSEEYERPELCARYCSEVCPIGQKHAHKVEFRPLEGAVLGFVKEFKDVKSIKNRLIEIAEDGVICEKEIDEFQMILKEIDELSQKIEMLKLWAMSRGIWIEKKKAAQRAVM